MTDLALPTEKVQAKLEGATGHIIFNNPERYNAVSLEMWDAVDQALSAFAADDQARAVSYTHLRAHETEA